ncbi:flagellar hook-basal body complex protein FliE [Erythrobacter sp. EC-HK427]|uniref:flagellar hook-basal body complex protein FliE n=1 Tax=Erythrobacter sp. EC-HK427 TaxID=2038396 RepID=UPI0012582291|nr:flagellar hook-basal body complex protein FliE [Erythrobacter sp. EC-HK427]VVT01655.1 Flagellar hook-basal body complex protein FliE [Erythrobacter sp. EC-HK427]
MNPVSGHGAGGLQQVLSLRQQVLEQSAALRELREAGAPASGVAAPAQPAGGGFAATLENALDQVNASQARSSELSAAYERGEVTDIAQVMMARQESGVAFEATLQMRNKLLSAYQEIMRMGV